MDYVTVTLVDEVLALHAEVLALRVLAGASVVDDPLQYLDMVVANIDAYTLPLVMNETQRVIVRERLEHTRELWVAHLQVTRPGGWRGLRYWLGRTLKRVRRVFVGASAREELPVIGATWPGLAGLGDLR